MRRLGGSPKRSMSLGGSRVAAPIGGTQPLGLVQERIPLSAWLGSHTRQVGTAHKCARSSFATLNTVSRHRQRAKQKDHRVMVFLLWLRMLGSNQRQPD